MSGLQIFRLLNLVKVRFDGLLRLLELLGLLRLPGYIRLVIRVIRKTAFKGYTAY